MIRSLRSLTFLFSLTILSSFTPSSAEEICHNHWWTEYASIRYQAIESLQEAAKYGLSCIYKSLAFQLDWESYFFTKNSPTDTYIGYVEKYDILFNWCDFYFDTSISRCEKNIQDYQEKLKQGTDDAYYLEQIKRSRESAILYRKETVSSKST